MPAIKANGTYRIVHQLEPIDAVIYTALAYEIAASVEAARLPVESRTACSYRLHIHDGSFFTTGGGYPDFDARTKELAAQHAYILYTDITDYYNQIYLHRLNNAIEFSDPSLKDKAKDIESFLSRINGKASQGIPVGPAASVVMSEALMTDIDMFIRDRQLPFTRYVDDIRIFSDDKESLDAVLRNLTMYLYENHRLTLASGKTKIMESDKYVAEYMNNPYDLEKEEIFESLEIFNPYTCETEEHKDEINENEAAEQAFLAAIEKAIGQKFLDVGLAKGIIRRARTMQSPVLIKTILENFEFFLPVVSDSMIYISQLINVGNIRNYQAAIENICSSKSVHNPLARYWLEWFIAHHAELLQGKHAQALINTSSSVENQAIAAVTGNNIAWVRHMKSRIYNMSARGRRAVLYSTRILPGDERTHWLKMTIGSTQFLIDKWVATWILETA